VLHLELSVVEKDKPNRLSRSWLHWTPVYILYQVTLKAKKSF